METNWHINDMSLPARKVITVWAGNVEVLVKQVEKGKAYAISQVPETAKVARLIAAAPDLLAALERIYRLCNRDSLGQENHNVTIRLITETIDKAFAKARGES